MVGCIYYPDDKWMPHTMDSLTGELGGVRTSKVAKHFSREGSVKETKV